MGFGAELLIFVMLGFLVLGPKRMHVMLGHVARAKAEFDKASRSLKSQLTAELEDRPAERLTKDSSQELEAPGLSLPSANLSRFLSSGADHATKMPGDR